MAKILVFHFTEKGRLPRLNKKELDEIVKKFHQVLIDYPDVKFNGTFVDENGIGICDWDAPNAKLVKEVIGKALGAPPVDPVIEVKRVL
ncbi:MAG: hypothetical protein QXJ17_06275 [Nitrososphaeria archaeon]